MSRETINFSWLIKLRWGAIGGQVATVLGAARLFHVELPIWTLFSIIAVELATNIACVIAARSGVEVREWWSGVVMTIDVVLLTALLYFSGGPFNPFSFLYLVEIALAAVIVGARWTWTLVAASLIGSGVLFIGEGPVGLASHADHMNLHLRGMWVAFGVAASFIVYFLMRVRHDLALRESELTAVQRRADRQDRLASLATLAAGAAHELATPLGTIAVAARELERLLERTGGSAEAREDVQLIRAQVGRCRAILDGMAVDAGQSAGEQPKLIALDDLVRQCLDGVADREQVHIELTDVTGAQLDVPARAIVQAIGSLLKNAKEASPQATPIQLRASTRANQACIEVTDRGHGMDPAILSRAGEPFFTTKETGHGMGLGLFLTRTLVERLGGEFALSSEPGVCTRALITLPLSTAKIA